MVDPRSDVVVVAARRATTVRILDVLRNWSSLGLVEPLYVVDLDALRPDQIGIPALRLEGGEVRAERLQESLASAAAPQRFRLMTLGEMEADFLHPTEAECVQLIDVLRNALPTTPLVAMNVIGWALKGAPLPDRFTVVGWHNVVISPETSLSPAQGSAPLEYDASDPVRLTHLAAAVCTLGGLWTGDRRAPFDDRPAPAGESLVAVRTFTRHLSTAQVQGQLVERVMDVSRSYPVPLVDGTSAWVIEDEDGAVREMADLLLEQHPEVLPRVRQEPPRHPQEQIGALQAIRMFFAFLGQALRNLPTAFVQGLIRDVSARTARAVNAAVFGGSDSNYSVVVNGYTADGTPASLAQMESVLDQAAPSRERGTLRGHLNHSSFWRDFVGAALTLLDAGNRSSELPPPTQGARRGVVQHSRRVAISAAEQFRPPEDVAPHVGGTTVATGDVLGAHLLGRRLADLQTRQPHLGGAVSSTLDSLRAWRDEHESTFVGRVGSRLGHSVDRLRKEIERIVTERRQITENSQVPASIEDTQRGLGRRLKIILFVAVLLVVAAVAVGALGLLAWWICAVVIISSVLGWFVGSVLTFTKGQAALFALLHQREEAANRLELLDAHLTEALEDLRRLTRVYRQYVDWAQALGTFVTRPMGTYEEAAHDSVIIGSHLPRNHRFGNARPDSEVLDDVSTELRRDLHQVAWLSEAWKAFMDEVPRSLGTDRLRITEDPDLVWSDPGVAESSVLSAWSAAVSSRTSWDGMREKVEEQVLRASTRADLAGRVMAHVETRDRDTGRLTSLDYDAFMAGLDQPIAQPDVQRLGNQIFGPSAAMAEPWRIQATIPYTNDTPQGRLLLVTQVSDAFAPHDLVRARASAPAEPEAPEQGPGSGAAGPKI